MEKEENTKQSLESEITRIVSIFLEKSKNKEIQVISHFDTDGITSAAIMIQTLKGLDLRFNLKILKGLEKDFITNLPKNKITLFIDLASGSLDYIKESGLEDVFIIDHHELVQEIPSNVEMINPQLHDKQKISSAGLAYLFSKEINPENKKYAKIAIIGMIGDRMEKDIGKLNNGILEDSEVQRKRGLLIYPATIPLNRVLEFSSNPYIPGVSGDIRGVLDLLRESGLTPEKGRYKSLIELSEGEMEKLMTSVMLRNPKSRDSEIVGDLFLIKLYNQLEDARELSAKINACSRSGESAAAIQLCMEVPNAKKKAQSIHTKYKRELIEGIKFMKETEKIQGKNFVIINAQDKVKDTMVGTIASILSSSSIYEEETMVTTMAYYDGKIKISARNAGGRGRNVRDVLHNIVTKMGGEVGGHEFAAGGIIKQSQEQEFIDSLKKNLEVEMVKIKSK